MRSRPIRAASTAAALVLLAVAGCSAASPEPGPTSAPATASTVAAQTPAATTHMPTPTPTPTWSIAMALPTPPPEMSRDDEAYPLVQKAAMETWETGVPFRETLRRHAAEAGLTLDEARLDEVCRPERYVERLDAMFDRLAALT